MGICTIYVTSKHGNGLQRYAIQRVLEDFDHGAVVITILMLILANRQLRSYIKREAAGLAGRFDPDELARRQRMDSALVDAYDRRGLLDGRRDMLGELMGAIAMESMSLIARPDCKLSTKEKREYVGAFVRSEYRNLMVAYARGGEASVLHCIEGLLARTGGTGMPCLVIELHAAALWIARRSRARILADVTLTT